MGALVAILSHEAPFRRSRATTMLAAAPHRGRHWELASTSTAALGIAADPDDRDAWLARENGTVAAFVGELDNDPELRRELIAAGVPPQADDPAGTLLAAWKTWGEDAFPRLRGRFTGAVTEGNTLRCFRDQVGLRTLYFRDDENAFSAATEGKQVAVAVPGGRRPSLAALEAILYGRLDAGETALEGVQRFPRASLSRAERGRKATFTRYWDPVDVLESADLSPADARERLTPLLEQAARRSLTGNDAVSLSGGVDSTAIAAFAAPAHLELSGRPLAALSAVYPDQPSVDERAYIELVTEHLGLPLHAYVPRARPLDDVARWVDVLDGPVDTVSVAEVAENYRRAKSLGARALLTGELAEYVYSMRQYLGAHLLLHARPLHLLRWARTERARGWGLRALAGDLAVSAAPAGALARVRPRRARRPALLPPWIDAGYLGASVLERDLQRRARRRWLEAQLDPLRGAATTVEADEICAAYCGVRVRRPLVDVDLWEFFLALRAEVKFSGPLSKRLVREAARGRLPDPVVDRRDKTAFDEHALAAADYAALRRWVDDPDVRMPGVDYPLLLSRVERGKMGVSELMWAYDLARVHAFLSLWR